MSSITDETYFVPVGSVHRVARIVEEPAPEPTARREEPAEGFVEAVTLAAADDDSCGLAEALDDAPPAEAAKLEDWDGPALEFIKNSVDPSKLGRALAKDVGLEAPTVEDEPIVVKATVHVSKTEKLEAAAGNGPLPLDPCPEIPNSKASMPTALLGRWSAKHGRCPQCGVALKADGTHRKRRVDAGGHQSKKKSVPDPAEQP